MNPFVRKSVSILALAAAALAFVSCSGSKVPESKKEIMDRFVAGTLPASYAPAAFFVHFANDQKVGEAAVKAHLDYFHEVDPDILKVQFEQFAPRIRELEVRDDWMPEDYYAPTVEIIKRLQEEAGDEAYVLPTVYSTFQVTTQSLGPRRIIEAAKENPEALKSVLECYTRALIWFVKQCKAAGIQGFYTPTQGGETKFYEVPGFFETFIRPYDLAVMNECNKDTKLNILHICDWEGTYDDLSKFKDYPGQIVNTPMVVDGKPFSLSDASKLFGGRPVLGGFNRQTEILSAPAETIAQMTKEILAGGPAGKIMIGADCTVSSAPHENLQAAVSTAHGAAK